MRFKKFNINPLDTAVVRICNGGLVKVVRIKIHTHRNFSMEPVKKKTFDKRVRVISNSKYSIFPLSRGFGVFRRKGKLLSNSQLLDRLEISLRIDDISSY